MTRTRSTVFRWISIIALCLTILGNAQGILDLADWAKVVAEYWRTATNYAWTKVFSTFGFTISEKTSQVLTISVIILLPAIVTRVRFGKWSFKKEDGLLTKESQEQNVFVPLILMFIFPIYFYIFAPQLLNDAMGDCVFEWGNPCVRSIKDLKNIDLYEIGFWFLGTFGLFFATIAIGHPKKIFLHLINGIIACGVIFLLSELSKLGLSIPDPKAL